MQAALETAFSLQHTPEAHSGAVHLTWRPGANRAPAVQAFNGSMVYWYNSTSYRDDLTWAAAWLYKATGDSGYLSDAYFYWTQHTDQEGIYDLYYLVGCRMLCTWLQQVP